MMRYGKIEITQSQLQQIVFATVLRVFKVFPRFELIIKSLTCMNQHYTLLCSIIKPFIQLFTYCADNGGKSTAQRESSKGHEFFIIDMRKVITFKMGHTCDISFE